LETVSACIAVYNGADHLSKALTSVVTQTFRPAEIIVLDDGSIDNSTEIARSFEGVTVLEQANGGIGAARRALVEAAKGDWIAFCDHDDWWEPNRLEAMIPATQQGNPTLIYSGAWHVDAKGLTTESPLHASPNAPSVDHLIPYPEDIWTSATLLRRASVIEVGNFNPYYRTGEDMLMWFQLGSLGQITQVPQRLVHMLRRPISTSSPDKRQFEYAVSLYDKEIIPNFDKWFPTLETRERHEYRRQLEAKLGFKMSILAAMIDMEGDRATAKKLHQRAIKLSPRAKGVWYRYFRNLLNKPSNPPI